MKAKPIRIGAKVRINWLLNEVLYNETGTIIDFDHLNDEVTIQLDRITPAMQRFDDAKTGVVNVDPCHVVVL